MAFKDYIKKKRQDYEAKRDKLAYRCLGPLKLIGIMAATLFILNFFFTGGTCERDYWTGQMVCQSTLFSDPVSLTIIYIVLFIGILYSFDFLLVLIYYWIYSGED